MAIRFINKVGEEYGQTSLPFDRTHAGVHATPHPEQAGRDLMYEKLQDVKIVTGTLRLFLVVVSQL